MPITTYHDLDAARTAHEEDGGYLLLRHEDYARRPRHDGEYCPTRTRPVYVLLSGMDDDEIRDAGYDPDDMPTEAMGWSEVE